MLYELGGMVIVHDASGCNSTYATHDEPRWYQQDSMIYISALTETDAVSGNDEKLICDIVQAAKDLNPRFIAVCGSPIPMMTGTDFDNIAYQVEVRSGIPALGLHTNGMHSYLQGASEALTALLKRFVRKDVKKTEHVSVNILGVTPLDFSVCGMAESMRQFLAENDMECVSCMSMGSTLDEIAQAAKARVNLVVSYAGLAAAEWMKQEFGIPCVTGVPAGEKFPVLLAEQLKQSAADGLDRYPCAERRVSGRKVIAGESIFAGSLAWELGAKVLCPLETAEKLLAPGDLRIPDETDAEKAFAEAEEIFADPMYQPVCPEHIPFRRMPHEAFSGRCYRKEIKNRICRKLEWRNEPC